MYVPTRPFDSEKRHYTVNLNNPLNNKWSTCPYPITRIDVDFTKLRDYRIYHLQICQSFSELLLINISLIINLFVLLEYRDLKWKASFISEI